LNFEKCIEGRKMNVVLTIVLAVQILTAIGMIGLILMQQGKGADMGASFGSGSAGSMFGSAGSANFLSRSTSALAAVFFVSTLSLAYLSNSVPKGTSNSGLLDKLSAPAAGASAPAAGASAAAAAASAVQPAAAASKAVGNEIPK
jgi:preprotein translocase subunit SecG